MPGEGLERTEKATPKKKEEARKKGQVAKSRDVIFAALLAGCYLMSIGTGFASSRIKSVMAEAFSYAGRPDFTADFLYVLLRRTATEFASIAGPALVAFLGAATLSGVAMAGLAVSSEALSPDISRIDPVQGFERIFSLRSVLEFVKSLVKLAAVALIVVLTLRKTVPVMVHLFYYRPSEAAEAWLQSTRRMIGLSAVAVGVVAGIDYLHQRWEQEKKMRMTKSELKQEMRNTDGDPMVKGRQRAIQREAAKRRMMADVPKSNLVVTNPTHVAVALKYKFGMNAPVVTAKGAGSVAERIKEEAVKAGVAIVEDKPLARALFKKVKIGKEIPVELYQAVAEVLRYVYMLDKKKSHGKGRAYERG
ncbi:MAG: flagellar biosynthesis protein FlhB [Nitrospirota bacterium]